MYSRFEIFIPELESGKLVFLFEKIIGRIEKLENLISRFVADSVTNLLNSKASISPVKVNHYYFDLIEKCLLFQQKTKGCFNISPMSFVSTSETGIKTNKGEQSIFFEFPNISLDFGAIGKGLALELAIQTIKDDGIENALINFGDSSVFALGSHPQGDFWPIKITNGKNSKIFQLKDNGLSSSGLHISDDKLIAHIIDPNTGILIDKNEKVVVISKCPLRAEVLSTAMFVASEEIRKEIKEEFKEDEITVL